MDLWVSSLRTTLPSRSTRTRLRSFRPGAAALRPAGGAPTLLLAARALPTVSAFPHGRKHRASTAHVLKHPGSEARPRGRFPLRVPGARSPPRAPLAGEVRAPRVPFARSWLRGEPFASLSMYCTLCNLLNTTMNCQHFFRLLVPLIRAGFIFGSQVPEL